MLFLVACRYTEWTREDACGTGSTGTIRFVESVPSVLPSLTIGHAWQADSDPSTGGPQVAPVRIEPGGEDSDQDAEVLAVGPRPWEGLDETQILERFQTDGIAVGKGKKKKGSIRSEILAKALHSVVRCHEKHVKARADARSLAEAKKATKEKRRQERAKREEVKSKAKGRGGPAVKTSKKSKAQPKAKSKTKGTTKRQTEAKAESEGKKRCKKGGAAGKAIGSESETLEETECSSNSETFDSASEEEQSEDEQPEVLVIAGKASNGPPIYLVQVESDVSRKNRGRERRQVQRTVSWETTG